MRIALRHIARGYARPVTTKQTLKGGIMLAISPAESCLLATLALGGPLGGALVALYDRFIGRAPTIYDVEPAAGQLRREALNVATVMLAHTAVGAAFLYSGAIRLHEDISLLRHALAFGVILFVIDAWYYAAHRLMHTK